MSLQRSWKTLCMLMIQSLYSYAYTTIPSHISPSFHVFHQLTRLHSLSSDYTTVMIVPTGIGAKIGGFAGDALPVCKLLAQICDRVITHPNVMNGAMLYEQLSNVLYVEGYALDEFASNRLGLIQCTKKSQKIGLLLDKSIEEDIRIRHIQVAEAFRATLGIDVCSCVVTNAPIGVSLATSSSGASWGCIQNIDTLIHGANELIQDGCTAIAVVARFPEDESDEEKAAFDAYRKQGGVDGIAGIISQYEVGAEAIISHLITQKFLVPCAHAPAFEPYPADKDTSPKSCAEELGYTFLPCVLNYLHRAPSLVKLNNNGIIPRDTIIASDVDSVVIPIDALGGPAVLAFLATGVLIIAVEENTTVMNISEIKLQSHANVVIARSYAEAAGIVAAHKAGILLSSITSNVERIPLRFLT